MVARNGYLYTTHMLFKVTFNDISVIYVKAHRCAGGLKKKLDLRSGSHAIEISLSLSKHWKGTNLFTAYSRNHPISVAFYAAHGDIIHCICALSFSIRGARCFSPMEYCDTVSPNLEWNGFRSQMMYLALKTHAAFKGETITRVNGYVSFFASKRLQNS